MGVKIVAAILAMTIIGGAFGVGLAMYGHRLEQNVAIKTEEQKQEMETTTMTVETEETTEEVTQEEITDPPNEGEIREMVNSLAGWLVEEEGRYGSVFEKGDEMEITASRAIEITVWVMYQDDSFSFKETVSGEEINGTVKGTLVESENYYLILSDALAEYLKKMFGSRFSISDYSSYDWLIQDSDGKLYFNMMFFNSRSLIPVLYNLSIFDAPDEEGEYIITAGYKHYGYGVSATEEEHNTEYIEYHMVSDDSSSYGWVITKLISLGTEETVRSHICNNVDLSVYYCLNRITVTRITAYKRRQLI